MGFKDKFMAKSPFNYSSKSTGQGSPLMKDGPRTKDFSKKDEKLKKRKEKRAALEATEGATGFERRLNYMADKSRAKKVEKEAKKEAKRQARDEKKSTRKADKATKRINKIEAKATKKVEKLNKRAGNITKKSEEKVAKLTPPSSNPTKPSTPKPNETQGNKPKETQGNKPKETGGKSNTRKEFEKAFAKARKAGDKTFMFKNEKYTTDIKKN